MSEQTAVAEETGNAVFAIVQGFDPTDIKLLEDVTKEDRVPWLSPVSQDEVARRLAAETAMGFRYAMGPVKVEVLPGWPEVETEFVEGLALLLYDFSADYQARLLVVVRPTIRRKGIGRKLVEVALAVARDNQNTTSVSVMVDDKNRGFFEKLGFEDAGDNLMVIQTP